MYKFILAVAVISLSACAGKSEQVSTADSTAVAAPAETTTVVTDSTAVAAPTTGEVAK